MRNALVLGVAIVGCFWLLGTTHILAAHPENRIDRGDDHSAIAQTHDPQASTDNPAIAACRKQAELFVRAWTRQVVPEDVTAASSVGLEILGDRLRVCSVAGRSIESETVPRPLACAAFDLPECAFVSMESSLLALSQNTLERQPDCTTIEGIESFKTPSMVMAQGVGPDAAVYEVNLITDGTKVVEGQAEVWIVDTPTSRRVGQLLSETWSRIRFRTDSRGLEVGSLRPIRIRVHVFPSDGPGGFGRIEMTEQCGIRTRRWRFEAAGSSHVDWLPCQWEARGAEPNSFVAF